MAVFFITCCLPTSITQALLYQLDPQAALSNLESVKATKYQRKVSTTLLDLVLTLLFHLLLFLLLLLFLPLFLPRLRGGNADTSQLTMVLNAEPVPDDNRVGS